MLKDKINLKSFFILNLGFLILSFSIVNFLIPSKLIAGGTTGIAMMLYHLYGTPVSFWFFILNIPLVIIGFYIFEREYGIKTVYGIIAITLYTKYMTQWMKLEYLEHTFNLYPILGALIGGILSGIGVGLAVSMNGNTGGTTIFAQIIEKYFKIKIGTTLNIADTIIVGASGFLIGGDSALLTIISLFICGRVVNIVKYNLGWIVSPPNNKAL